MKQTLLNGQIIKCPKCSKDYVTKHAQVWRGRGDQKRRVQSYQCQECGKIFNELEIK